MPEEHIRKVLDAIVKGRLVPFLGAGANMCGRPAGVGYQPGQYLPSGRELAMYLSQNFDFLGVDSEDLSRVAQCIALDPGSGPLYEELRKVFDADYPLTALHRFLAKIPHVLRSRGCLKCYQLILTTNYDDLLERAFQDAGEPFDLVTYVADGNQRGKFLHRSPEGDVKLIEKPNEYPGFSLESRSVIMKIHGTVDRTNPDRDSFIITEDHYIDYLTRADVSELVPVTLAAKLKMSHFLFLGYSLMDWNLRVILHRIWGEQRLTFNSWAVQLNTKDLDRKFWAKRGVEIINQSLDAYVALLSEGLAAQSS